MKAQRWQRETRASWSSVRDRRQRVQDFLEPCQGKAAVLVVCWTHEQKQAASVPSVSSAFDRFLEVGAQQCFGLEMAVHRYSMEWPCLLGVAVPRGLFPLLLWLLVYGCTLFFFLPFGFFHNRHCSALLVTEALTKFFDFKFKRTSWAESRTLNNIRFEYISFGLGNSEKCTFVFFWEF